MLKRNIPIMYYVLQRIKMIEIRKNGVLNYFEFMNNGHMILLQ